MNRFTWWYEHYDTSSRIITWWYEHNYTSSRIITILLPFPESISNTVGNRKLTLPFQLTPNRIQTELTDTRNEWCMHQLFIIIMFKICLLHSNMLSGENKSLVLLCDKVEHSFTRGREMINHWKLIYWEEGILPDNNHNYYVFQAT